MTISTRQGDGGRTRLLSGEEVSKDHPRTSAYGTLDEAVSAIGLGRALAEDERVRDELRTIQEACFLIGAELATTAGKASGLKERITAEDLKVLEVLCAELEDELDLAPVFTIPGAAAAGAAVDLARTIVRRLEREVVSLEKEEDLDNPVLLPYLNRLSDALFLLARYEEKQQGVAPEHREG